MEKQGKTTPFSSGVLSVTGSRNIHFIHDFTVVEYKRTGRQVIYWHNLVKLIAPSK